MQIRDERTKMRAITTHEPLNNTHWRTVYAPVPRLIAHLDEAAAAAAGNRFCGCSAAVVHSTGFQ
jgi:hypothetical protein